MPQNMMSNRARVARRSSWGWMRCGTSSKKTSQTLDLESSGKTYAAVVPPGQLRMSKAKTHGIERNHCRQRHWFGRFKRRSIIVSKSKEMVDLTMALFAKFWVNGNQDELLSLLT